MDNDQTLSNMMNLAKLFAPTTASSHSNDSHSQSWPMFPIDAQIHTEPLRVCKSLVPYLPFEKQKNISIFIKVFELMSVVNHFSQLEASEKTTSNFRKSENWQTDMLSSIKSSLDPGNAYLVDILLKVNDVKKILETAQTGNSPKSPDLAPAPKKAEPSKDFMENISPMLDDQQKKMLEMLSTIIK